jgi:hypothetical protein
MDSARNIKKIAVRSSANVHIATGEGLKEKLMK